MFDFITRRRIIFCIIAFLFVTIGILFLANLPTTVIRQAVPSYYKIPSLNISTDKEQQTSTCYLTEPVKIETLCQKCTSYERRSKAVGCSPSGYREYVECSKSNIKIYRSCPIPTHIQKQHFWLFEGFIIFIGLLSISSVHLRQKKLDKHMVEKIKRQIGESEE